MPVQRRENRSAMYSVKLSDLEADALEREAEINSLTLSETLRTLLRSTPSYRYLANNRHHAAIVKDAKENNQSSKQDTKQDSNNDVKSAA